MIVGYQEDTFQAMWLDVETFEQAGVTKKKAEQELRREFAKWYL